MLFSLMQQRLNSGKAQRKRGQIMQIQQHQNHHICRAPRCLHLVPSQPWGTPRGKASWGPSSRAGFRGLEDWDEGRKALGANVLWTCPERQAAGVGAPEPRLGVVGASQPWRGEASMKWQCLLESLEMEESWKWSSIRKM